MQQKEKIIIYQLLVRLAGNTKTEMKPWGTKAENGCGTFNDLTQHMLDEIAALGANHIWLTGVLEHASCTGYPEQGIPPGNPLVIKGRAGSPYAICDYYDVAPDLAKDVENRMEEFELLIERCHIAGLKPIIDFVPNHVAREYNSDRTEGRNYFGKSDNSKIAFHPDNNFYYIPNHALELPSEVYRQPHITDSGNLKYHENPAKATGNDYFSHKPGFDDWYETVKLNYGIDYFSNRKHHFEPVPDTWHKMLDILSHWANKKIAGFRCDMAEMVPVEFWKWCIDKIRKQYPDILFIAEIYNPNLYGSFIGAGFDFLYDKVGLYDAIRAVLTEGRPAASLQDEWKKLNGLDEHMLRFIENHDEQRVASKHFAGSAKAGIPAITVAATMHQGPLMLYFGQETGEAAQGASGYSGDDGRTSIFDYWTVPSFQRWYNRGKCNDTLLGQDEKQLRLFYKNLLKMIKTPTISNGLFYDLMWFNKHVNQQSIYVFLRWDQELVWLVVANFEKTKETIANIKIPKHFFDLRNNTDNKTIWTINSILHGFDSLKLKQEELINEGIAVRIPDLSAMILSLKNQ